MLGAILDIDSTAKVVVVTGRAEREYRRNALAKGAYDFFSKPYDLDELKIVLPRAHYLFTLEEEHRYLGRRAQGESLPQMLSTSQSMQEVFAMIRKVATTEVPVLIVGESGMAITDTTSNIIALRSSATIPLSKYLF